MVYGACTNPSRSKASRCDDFANRHALVTTVKRCPNRGLLFYPLLDRVGVIVITLLPTGYISQNVPNGADSSTEPSKSTWSALPRI